MGISTMPVPDLRKKINALLGSPPRPIFVTQRGNVKAVLVDIEPYNELLDEMDDLRDARDAEIQREAAAAREAGARAETVPLQTILDQHCL